MNKFKITPLLLPIIIILLIVSNGQKILAQEIIETENVIVESETEVNSVEENPTAENETIENETIENETIENETIENGSIENVALNDTFAYEVEGLILEYKILSLADETAQGTVMVVGMPENTNFTGEVRIPATVTYYDIPYSVTEIGNNSFYQNNNITSVIIPEGVIKIGDKAFGYCNSLTDVIIGDSVTYIGDTAFGSCINLKNVKLPKNLYIIQDWAFDDCKSLETIDLPEGLHTIGDLAFSNCTGLKNVRLPSNISLLAWQAFQGTNIIFWVEMNTNAASYCKGRYYTYNYITATPTDKIALDGIKINPIFRQSYSDRLPLHIGKSATFSISLYPNNATERTVTWSSSNSGIAKVSADGTVTAVSSGTATITASLGTKTAKMTINVNPDSPKSVKAISAGVNSIKISWNHVRNAKNYRVYRASSKSGKYTRIADVTTLSYEDSGLLDATTYYYKVYAYGSIGGDYSPSYFSSITSAKTKVGNLEFLLANYDSNQSIRLLLGNVPGAKGYMIYRANSANGTYQLVKSVGTSSYIYTDKALTKGKTYYYKVKAYNYVNKVKVYSDYSKTVSASTKLPSYVTFGTIEKNVDKILGQPSGTHYFQASRTYEYYYKKDIMSGPVETAAVYLKEINGERIVIGWSNRYNGLKISDGDERNTGTFTFGSTMEEVNKAMGTPFDFEYFYGGTTYFGYTIRKKSVGYMYGSTITFDDDMRVSGWKNIKGSLKVKYGADKPTKSQITLGTSLSEVQKALGTPDSLSSSGYPQEYAKYLTYGNTILTFDENLELAGWSNKEKTNISIGKKDVTAKTVKVGTSLKDVIKAMGTPDSYIIDPNYPSSLKYMIYGNKIYNFDNNRKVSSIQSR